MRDPLRRPKAAGERLTFYDDAVYVLESSLSGGRHRWPSIEYRKDPVRFFREVLGIEPWAPVQVGVLEAVRDFPRVAWKSGHRVSKSNTCAGLALWFYCSYDDARVPMTAPTARQVDDILWREIRMMKTRSGKCVACKLEDPLDLRIKRPCPHSSAIDGELADRAKTGLVSADFREIRGFTARDVDDITGFAGKNLFFQVDECSGVADEIFEGLEGNRAGWSEDGSGTVRELLTGNPTKTSGKFFRAFNSESNLYKCITTSSEESPNVVAGREVIPGLATRAWIAEKEEMWGKESPLFIVRVKGEFALKEDGKIFSVHAIQEAEQRWPDAAELGRLYIGLDPAGESGTGDEAVFCTRRGQKQLGFSVHRGLSPEAHLVQLLGLIKTTARDREKPVVVLDREGSVGAQLYGYLRNYVETNDTFDLVAVRASDRAIRNPQIYDRMRDELTGNLEAWIREGGAIVEDTQLAGEMHELEWKQAVNGRLKVTPKDVLRKLLKRSPDRYDALALAAWEPLSLREELPQSAAAIAAEEDVAARGPAGLDPYAGTAAFRPRR